MKATYTSIPVDLCQYALINNRVNHLKLFLYLKTTSSGHISMKNYNLYSAWASDLELSERTIRNLFKWLIKNKWLTVNSKRVSYRIISYKQLNRKLGFTNPKCFVFEEEFSKLKSFCSASVCTQAAKRKRYFDKIKRQSVSKLGDTSKNCNSRRNNLELSTSYLASFLGVSKTTAHNIKKDATKFHLLEIKSQKNYLLDKLGNKIEQDKMMIFRKNNQKLSGRLRTKKGFIAVIESNLVKSNLIMKTKRFKYRENI